MTYRAEPITQRDGSELASSNCRMASAATGIDYHTLGAQLSTGAKMRDRSGDPDGGTTSDDAERAWASYGYELRIRDGHTWADAELDLEAGRLVMLDIWAATAGGPCLSGSGAYGHTIAVAPERSADGKWLVADPWCSPGKWKWWSASKLRAGAEEWGRRCGRSTAGLGYGRDIRTVPRPILLAVVRLLMTIWTPEHPAPDELAEDGGTGGGQAILYTTTAKRAGGDDVAINLTGDITSAHLVDIPEGIGYYGDSGLTDRLGTIGDGGRTFPYLGLALDSDAWAVSISTAHPYDDGVKRPTCCYVPRGSGPGPYDAPPVDSDEYRAALESIEETAEDALAE